MLSAEQIDIIADEYIIGLYNDMERDVIADIARRIQKTGTYTETAELMAKAMREQGYSTARIQHEAMKMLNADAAYKMAVAEQTKSYKQYIKNLIKDIVAKAKIAGNALVSEAGRMSWNEDLRVWSAQGINLSKPSALSTLIEAFRRQTVDELRNITRTSGLKGTSLGTVGIINAYQRALDQAVLKISSGAFSQEQVIRQLIEELSRSGLRTIEYASGRTYQIDTAVRMCVRTACSQLSGKMTEMNIQKTGVDLVYVSAHAGARPTHADWQGKVYYYYEDRPYKDCGWLFDKEPCNGGKGTGYGTVTGLKGVNCTHEFYPHWEGTPIPEFKDHDPVTYNGKEHTFYEATQEMRKQERDIRATKRAIEASEAVGQDTSELKARLSLQNKKYKQFKALCGINR